MSGTRNLLLCLALLAMPWIVPAQKVDPNDPKNIEKGKSLLQAVVDLRGGAKYMEYKSMTATGMFTPFEGGISQIPQPFTDYMIYPDRERVDFGKGKKKDRLIQVNTGKTGWIYNGDAQTIKDMTEKQVENFQQGLEFDLDRILRFVRTRPETKIWFSGREETRPGERADVVTVEWGEGKRMAILLSPLDKLPVKITYEKTEDGKTLRQEVKFYQYVTYDGVRFPNIVDFFTNGVQTTRLNYDNIRLNAPIPDPLFVKPATIKEIR
ncbi:MAG: hypothetical protein ACKV2V_04095 [Blastocatellia bacterium]